MRKDGYAVEDTAHVEDTAVTTGMTEPAAQSRWRRHSHGRSGRWRTVAGVGLLGAAALLGVSAYQQMHATDAGSEQTQLQARAALEAAWGDPTDEGPVEVDLGAIERDAGGLADMNTNATAMTVGGAAGAAGASGAWAETAHAVGLLEIPAYGPDWSYVVMNDVDQASLAAGPGWYPESALPGEPGNTALAGHRMGYGAPFTDLAALRSCDEIVLHTRTHTYIYRVLPMSTDPMVRAVSMTSCLRGHLAADISHGAYAQVPGRHITDPQDVSVLEAVPGGGTAGIDTAVTGTAVTGTAVTGTAVTGTAVTDTAGADVLDEEASARRSLLTLTTCHPWYSNEQRQIVHAVLTEVTGNGNSVDGTAAS